MPSDEIEDICKSVLDKAIWECLAGVTSPLNPAIAFNSSQPAAAVITLEELDRKFGEMQRLVASSLVELFVCEMDMWHPWVTKLQAEGCVVLENQYMPQGKAWIRSPDSEGLLDLATGKAFLMDRIWRGAMNKGSYEKLLTKLRIG